MEQLAVLTRCLLLHEIYAFEGLRLFSAASPRMGTRVSNAAFGRTQANFVYLRRNEMVWAFLLAVVGMFKQIQVKFRIRNSWCASVVYYSCYVCSRFKYSIQLAQLSVLLVRILDGMTDMGVHA